MFAQHGRAGSRSGGKISLMSARAGRAGRPGKRKSRCLGVALEAEMRGVASAPEADGSPWDASASEKECEAAGHEQVILGEADPGASPVAQPAGLGEVAPGSDAAAELAGLGEAYPGVGAGGDAMLASGDLLSPEDYQLGRKLNASSPAGAFLKFDRGSSDHPGTTDLDSWKRWKDLVRCWVGPNLSVHNCEAFLSCRGAVPGDMRRRVEDCPRSEQFLGWCVAFYADRKRGRWFYWPLAWRLWALSYARQLVVTGRMDMAPTMIWNEVALRHRTRED